MNRCNEKVEYPRYDVPISTDGTVCYLTIYLGSNWTTDKTKGCPIYIDYPIYVVPKTTDGYPYAYAKITIVQPCTFVITWPSYVCSITTSGMYSITTN